jgi:hypothetical protein
VGKIRCRGATYAWAGMRVFRNWRMRGASRWRREEGKASMADVMRERAEES